MPAIKTGIRGFLQTGQTSCHDVDGVEIECMHSGQDAEFRSGLDWPVPRFDRDADIVLDKLTGLYWHANANLAGFPLEWAEAHRFIEQINAASETDYDDWRLPDRRALRSLISHQSRRPALPADHPFDNVFTHWYWSSTTVAAHPDHAWYVSMDGGRMFYGGKDQAFMVWPVRGSGNGSMLKVAQDVNSDSTGPRFESLSSGIHDRFTGLLWQSRATLTAGDLSWREALDAVERLNGRRRSRRWRLPNINELESLVDCSQFNPALPVAHPFSGVGSIYWSSTTSLYEPDWAWALYLDDGAIGVGQKAFARFKAWAVSDAE